MENSLVLLQQDFKLFLQALWAELGLPSPTRAQYAIADYLQNGPKRLQVQAFRGVGKSWITGAFVLWTLFNDPERKVMIISASKERADNMSIFLQKLIIDTPWLSHLQPKSDDSRWSRISFDVNCSPHQAPSVKSVGITGQLTGSRADLMILDDVEVPGNSLTEFMREKLLQLCTEAESILTPKSDSRIMYLGTPQTTFTIYRRLAERNYRPLVWPARYPRQDKLSKYEGVLAPEIQEDVDMGAEEWSPTDDRFTDEDLIEREASMGRSNFMLQFQLDTTLSDAQKFPLKMADLVITSVNPTTAPEDIICAQILVKSYEMPQQSASRVITFTLQCNSWESGAAMMKRFAVLTQAVVERMKRLPPSSLNEMDLSICMRCQPTETGTRIVPCSTSSPNAEHMESQAWLLKQTLEMAS